ncbi:MAG: hypothetical protein M0Z69_08490 [Actinomycetota bacterium]|nr:hypothetical protein [Actinomycetota bacterium]
MLRGTRVLVGLVMAGASSLALLGGTGSAMATTPKEHRFAKPVTFTGKISCAMTGSITASPPLKLATAATVTLTMKGALARCSGAMTQHKVKILGAALNGTSKGSLSCVSLTKALPALSGTVTYRTHGGKATVTKFKFSAGTLAATAMPVTATYPAKGAKASSAGSFAGRTAALHGVVGQTITALTASCRTGLKTISLVKGSNFKA